MISIIITVYNRERYLADTIKSVINQTYKYFELIIWDDGSTDNSVAIARHYATLDSRIRVIDSPHLGRGEALKKAVESSRGEYIGFVDSDDLLSETALEDTLKILEKHTNYDMVYTDYTVIDANGLYVEYGPLCQTPYDKNQLLLEFMTFHFRLIRRSIYDQVGGIDSSFDYGQDYDLCLKISELTNIYHLSVPLYYYRNHKQSITGKQRLQQILYSQKAIQNAFDRRGMGEEYDLDFNLTMRVQLTRKPINEIIKKPKVSIILPTYNRKYCLDCAIQSVLSQTFTDYELIIIDDGSTDGTTEWLKVTYPTLKLITLEANQGASAARNAGIKIARGEYIAFIDSDDQWFSQYLANQVLLLNKSPRAVLSYAQGNNPINNLDLIASMLLSNFIETLSQVVIPAWALQKVGLFDERLKVCHDRELYLRLFAIGNPVCLQEKLINKFWQLDSLVASDNYETWLADGLLLIDIFYSKPENKYYLHLKSNAIRMFKERVEKAKQGWS